MQYWDMCEEGAIRLSVLYGRMPNRNSLTIEPASRAQCNWNASHTLAGMEEGYELHTECYKNPVAPEGHQRSTAAAVGDEGCAKESIHKKLAILFSQAQDPLEAVGRGSFFG